MGGDGRGGWQGVPDDGGLWWLLGPVGKEDEGAGFSIGRVRTLSLVSCGRAGADAVALVMCVFVGSLEGALRLVEQEFEEAGHCHP